MKHLLLLLSASSLCTSTAHAQLGVRLGGNLAKMNTEDGQGVSSSSGALAGYQVGITYQLPLDAHLALVPEVQYSYERLTLAQASVGSFGTGFTADMRWRMHYVNVPVLVRVTFGPVYVEAGPQAGLLMGGRRLGAQVVTNYSLGIPPKTNEIDQALTDTNAGFDLGACVGLGLKLPASLGVSVRAYQGLVACNGDGSSYEGRYRRQTLQASLTYQLPARH